MEIKKYFIYILFFVIGILTFSTSNISKIIVEIRQEVNKIDKNIKQYKMVYKETEGDANETFYYDKKGELKKTVINYLTVSTDGTIEEYYKNGKKIFIYVVEYVYEWDDEKGMPSDKYRREERRYYFDNNEKLIRYIDEKGKIIENSKSLSEVIIR